MLENNAKKFKNSKLLMAAATLTPMFGTALSAVTANSPAITSIVAHAAEESGTDDNKDTDDVSNTYTVHFKGDNGANIPDTTVKLTKIGDSTYKLECQGSKFFNDGTYTDPYKSHKEKEILYGVLAKALNSDGIGKYVGKQGIKNMAVSGNNINVTFGKYEDADLPNWSGTPSYNPNSQVTSSGASDANSVVPGGSDYNDSNAGATVLPPSNVNNNGDGAGNNEQSDRYAQTNSGAVSAGGFHDNGSSAASDNSNASSSATSDNNSAASDNTGSNASSATSDNVNSGASSNASSAASDKTNSATSDKASDKVNDSKSASSAANNTSKAAAAQGTNKNASTTAVPGTVGGTTTLGTTTPSTSGSLAQTNVQAAKKDNVSVAALLGIATSGLLLNLSNSKLSIKKRNY